MAMKVSHSMAWLAGLGLMLALPGVSWAQQELIDEFYDAINNPDKKVKPQENTVEAYRKTIPLHPYNNSGSQTNNAGTQLDEMAVAISLTGLSLLDQTFKALNGQNINGNTGANAKDNLVTALMAQAIAKSSQISSADIQNYVDNFVNTYSDDIDRAMNAPNPEYALDQLLNTMADDLSNHIANDVAAIMARSEATANSKSNARETAQAYTENAMSDATVTALAQGDAHSMNDAQSINDGISGVKTKAIMNTATKVLAGTAGLAAGTSSETTSITSSKTSSRTTSRAASGTTSETSSGSALGEGSYVAAALQAEAENPLPADLKKCYATAKDEHDQAACVWKEVELWDQRLNANYQAAMKRCKFLGANVGNDELSELCAKQLKAAELKWIKYRDSMIESGTYLAPDYFGVESQVQQAQYALDIVRNQALLLNKFHERVKQN